MLINENGVSVEFYMEAVHQQAESQKQGRPIFKETEHIRIVIPGDKDNVVMQHATDLHRRKYPEAYKAFKNSEHTTRQGTPLEEWSPMTKSQVKEAKHFEVHTVEQLAGASDDAMQRMGMGFLALRQKAQVWLSEVRDGQAAAELHAENERMKARLAALEEAMLRQNPQEPAPERGRPGRKPKAAEEKADDKPEDQDAE